jgi:hypothetical protein
MHDALLSSTCLQLAPPGGNRTGHVGTDGRGSPANGEASERAFGLVAQDPESGHYRIGPAAVTIGLIGLRLPSPVRQLNDALPRLRDEINETMTGAIYFALRASCALSAAATDSSRPSARMTFLI